MLDGTLPWLAVHELWLPILLALCACRPESSEGERIPLESCRLEGLGVEAQCGTHEVAEDPADPASRRISLRVAVVPALSDAAHPDPLFVLVGGPGQAATRAGAAVAQAFSEVRKRRDVVLVDQRGTGGSSPLDCPDDDDRLAEALAPEARPARTAACRRGLDADPTRYVTSFAVDDLDQVRRALGYDRVNLWGGSYGTRVALVYFRRHPESTRSLILDGAAPTDIELPSHVPRDAQRALDALLHDCRHEPTCARRFPGLGGQIEELLSALEGEPREIALKHPRTGQPLRATVTRDGLAAALVSLLYMPALSSLLPLAIQQATAGDYAPLVAQLSLLAENESVAEGMYLSIVCSEDVPRVDPASVGALTRGTFLGAAGLERLGRECTEWPRARLPQSYFDPIEGAVPTLIFSGALDPVTPPSWGELTSSRLSQSRHLVVDGAGHGVSTAGCAPDLVAEFLDGLDASSLDASCLSKQRRPPFFTRVTGPAP